MNLHMLILTLNRRSEAESVISVKDTVSLSIAA